MTQPGRGGCAVLCACLPGAAREEDHVTQQTMPEQSQSRHADKARTKGWRRGARGGNPPGASGGGRDGAEAQADESGLPVS